MKKNSRISPTGPEADDCNSSSEEEWESATRIGLLGSMTTSLLVIPSQQQLDTLLMDQKKKALLEKMELL